jgi:hypothetical protein
MKPASGAKGGEEVMRGHSSSKELDLAERSLEAFQKQNSLDRWIFRRKHI